MQTAAATGNNRNAAIVAGAGKGDMPMNKKSTFAGIVLIAFGAFLLLGKFGVIEAGAANLWPAFLLIPGLFFHYLRFGQGANSGVLVPGGILVTYSLMFFACNIIGWDAMAYLWPGFIFGVAVGLFEAYFFDPHKTRGLLVASGVLGIISAVFFGFSLAATGGAYLLALAMIAAGIVMILRRPRR